MNAKLLEAFRATREHETPLTTVYPLSGYKDAGGMVYIDGLVIEDALTWPEPDPSRGRWNLLVDRDDFFSDDLEILEGRLCEWADDNGMVDDLKAELPEEG